MNKKIVGSNKKGRPNKVDDACNSELPYLQKPYTRNHSAPPSQDFTGYFHSSPKLNNPACVATSHSSRTPVPTAHDILQSLRWNPVVETSSIDDKYLQLEDPVQDFGQIPVEDSGLKCKCAKCSFKCCPSKKSLSKEKVSVFKDNIMTFNNQATMTVMLAETGVGVTPISSFHVHSSDASIAADVVRRDAHVNVHSRKYNREHCPTPILKNSRPWSAMQTSIKSCSQRSDDVSSLSKSNDDYPSSDYDYPTCSSPSYEYEPIDYPQSPEKDYHHYRNSATSNNKSPYKVSNTKKPVTPRKVLYNEGISDFVAGRYLATLEKTPSTSTLRRNNSKAPPKDKYYYDYEEIRVLPYARKTDSRYHTYCKLSASQQKLHDSNHIRHLDVGPDMLRQSLLTKPLGYAKFTAGKIPKKMLTSDTNIEAYIEKNYPNNLLPPRRI